MFMRTAKGGEDAQTGWKATHELIRTLPDAYVQTSVGTRLHFA